MLITDQLWLAGAFIKSAGAYRAGDSMNGGLQQGGMGKKNLPPSARLQRMQTFGGKTMTKAFAAPRSPYKALIPGEVIRLAQLKRLNDMLPGSRNTLVEGTKKMVSNPHAQLPAILPKK